MVVLCGLARRGESWSAGALGEYARQQGVYVLHHAGSIIYVGKTDGPTMSFGMRLRREFQETASGGKHIFPKLAQLQTPPDILASFITLREIQELVKCEKELRSVLEGWLIVKARYGDTLPAI